jgi:hypothetical protein
MKIRVSCKIKRAYAIRGKNVRDLFWQPILINRPAKAVFKLRITNRPKKELIVDPSLVYVSDPTPVLLTHQKFPFQYSDNEERSFEVDFRPKTTDSVEFRLQFRDLAGNDEVRGDGNYLVENKIYSKYFFVHSSFEYALFWFAGVSTIGAIVEIINLLLSLKII